MVLREHDSKVNSLLYFLDIEGRKKIRVDFKVYERSRSDREKLSFPYLTNQLRDLVSSHSRLNIVPNDCKRGFCKRHFEILRNSLTNNLPEYFSRSLLPERVVSLSLLRHRPSWRR